ncbi:hypothetical protein EVAR_5901_1 [Eumeta japonica]|uniref:Uncharacterized protein n=1 Tax=Eumeta variegata TaxID=151549 RepID=A0A4C1TC20_EUMVA|nr:hypothetical protein EVAR_5901_1 [Eumeta japonica]
MVNKQRAGRQRASNVSAGANGSLHRTATSSQHAALVPPPAVRGVSVISKYSISVFLTRHSLVTAPPAVRGRCYGRRTARLRVRLCRNLALGGSSQFHVEDNLLELVFRSDFLMEIVHCQPPAAPGPAPPPPPPAQS